MIPESDKKFAENYGWPFAVFLTILIAPGVITYLTLQTLSIQVANTTPPQNFTPLLSEPHTYLYIKPLVYFSLFIIILLIITTYAFYRHILNFWPFNL